MSNIMAVLLNGIAQLEYDRAKSLPPQQELYLDKMDQKMDEGIQVGDEIIHEPDLNQRAQFVAANLASAILSDQEASAAALCTYLATRLPELKQVKITHSNDNAAELSIELVFDEEYQKQISVQLH
ncbi:hypothetical protein [Kaarinaea lacus]